MWLAKKKNVHCKFYFGIRPEIKNKKFDQITSVNIILTMCNDKKYLNQ